MSNALDLALSGVGRTPRPVLGSLSIRKLTKISSLGFSAEKWEHG